MRKEELPRLSRCDASEKFCAGAGEWFGRRGLFSGFF